MTITAKNYVAQAQAGLREWAEWVSESSPQDAETAREFSESIGEAVHFALPDGGRIMNDNLRGLSGLELRLPYPSITVEYYVIEKDRPEFEIPEKQFNTPKRIAFAWEIPDGFLGDAPEFSDGGIVVTAANYVISEDCPEGYWCPVIAGVAIPRNWESQEGGRKSAASIEMGPSVACLDVILLREHYAELAHKYGKEKASHLARSDIADEMSAVLSLCEALSCSNVDSEVIEPVDQAKNAKRVRRGKLPIYETRRLVIKAPLTRSTKDCVPGNSDRSGPREHLRRGHIRRLSDGRRIWVQACVVGNRENGVIHKSYAVTN